MLENKFREEKHNLCCLLEKITSYFQLRFSANSCNLSTTWRNELPPSQIQSLPQGNPEAVTSPGVVKCCPSQGWTSHLGLTARLHQETRQHSSNCREAGKGRMSPCAWPPAVPVLSWKGYSGHWSKVVSLCSYWWRLMVRVLSQLCSSEVQRKVSVYG